MIWLSLRRERSEPSCVNGGTLPAVSDDRPDMELDELAQRANVPIEFVQRLAALDGLSDNVSSAFGRELGRTRLLYAWSQAGFSPETIMRLVDQKALSIDFP